VRLYALNGVQVAELRPRQEGEQPLVYEWDGRDGTGSKVAPGLYLVRLHLASDAGDEELTRLVSVAY
jgi:flagellar hook assembly protein FlgD